MLGMLLTLLPMFLLAVVTAIAGTFFGAALFVSLVEHPARRAISPGAAVEEFGISYRRATVVQGGLAMLGLVLGCVAAWQFHDWHVAINALLLGLNIPVTLLLILPTNKRLLDPSRDVNTGTAELLGRWSRLHAIRTVLGGLAFGLMLYRLVLHAGA